MLQPMLLPSNPAIEAYKRKTRVQMLLINETPASRVTYSMPDCTTHELLAAVIGGANQLESAQGILEKYNNDLRRVMNAHPKDIGLVPGVGEQTGIRIKAALQLGIRLARNETERNIKIINSPADAANLVQYEMAQLDHEELWIINLNTRNGVQEITHLYKGSVNSSQVRVAELFQNAIKIRASAIIMAHNHPSGDPSPSPDDVALTRAVLSAGKMLDIQVLDHVVIGQGNWVSLKERGLGFS
jgi:DNA repair protein RadC